MHSHELCSRLTSLFDNKGLMNAANKSELKHALHDLYVISWCILSDRPRDTNFVIDGESSLHKIAWTIGNTNLCRHLSNLHMLSAEKLWIFVVLDGGYLNPSIKDTTHLSRSNGKIGRKIVPVLTNRPLIIKKIGVSTEQPRKSDRSRDQCLSCKWRCWL